VNKFNGESYDVYKLLEKIPKGKVN